MNFHGGNYNEKEITIKNMHYEFSNDIHFVYVKKDKHYSHMWMHRW